jgi:hypothetical protein
MKRILSSPITYFNLLTVGTLTLVGVLHNQYHHDMEKDADAFVFQWCRVNPEECKSFANR